MDSSHAKLLLLFAFTISLRYVESDSKPGVSNKSFFNLISNVEEQEANLEHDRSKRADVSAIKGDYVESRISEYTEEEKQAILDKHLEFRKQVNPEASNMEYMQWNDDLARLAELWASVCFWGHGMTDHTELIDNFDSIGQNLWLGSGKPNGVNAVLSWHDGEVNHYNYTENNCGKVCGHYTQVVWATSREVGCGRAFCAQLIDNEGTPLSGPTNMNRWIAACHYAPGGNYVGEKPYKSGPTCSECQPGVGCFEEACRSCSDHNGPCECRRLCQNCGTRTSDCKCSCKPGWYGDTCSTKCENIPGADCSTSPAYCSVNPALPTNCPLLCGLCVGGDEPCITTTPPTGKTEPITTNAVTPTKQTTATEPSDAPCDGKMCQNGGTLSRKCKCKCTSEYTGVTCAKSRRQVREGVEILLGGNIDQYTSYERILREAVARCITKYCNKNVKKCCGRKPDRSDEENRQTFDFISHNDVMTAQGYPEPDSTRDGVFWTMLVVTVPENTDLCENGVQSSERRKRDLVQILGRIRRDHGDSHEVYLDQDILFTVISENRQNISDEAGVPFEEIQRGEVAEDKPGGTKPGVVAVIVIFVLLIVIVIVIVVIVILKRSGVDLPDWIPDSFPQPWSKEEKNPKSNPGKEEHAHENNQVQEKKPDKVPT